MRLTIVIAVVLAFLFLTACSGTGAKRTSSPYSNWHALQDRGGSR